MAPFCNFFIKQLLSPRHTLQKLAP